MSISEKDIEKVADLARIGVTEEQTAQLKGDLNNILNLVEKMDSVNVDSVQPLAHPFDAVQPLREDKITETDQRELFQSIAPKVHSGLYIVPKVLDSE